MRAPRVHLVAEIFRQGTIRETRMGKKADRPDGLKSFDREGMTWLRSNFRGFCRPPDLIRIRKGESGRMGGRGRGGIVGRNGSRSGLFSILRDDIWEDLDGMKGWVLNRENFEKIFRIFGIFGIGKIKLNLDFERRKYFGNIWWYGIGRKSTWEWFFSLMDVFEEWSWTVRILGKKQVTPENYTRGNFRFFGESST